jgi:hypothetical protein
MFHRYDLESHSFNTEAHLIQELLTPTRRHPAAGHPWFNPVGLCKLHAVAPELSYSPTV